MCKFARADSLRILRQKEVDCWWTFVVSGQVRATAAVAYRKRNLSYKVFFRRRPRRGRNNESLRNTEQRSSYRSNLCFAVDPVNFYGNAMPKKLNTNIVTTEKNYERSTVTTVCRCNCLKTESTNRLPRVADQRCGGACQTFIVKAFKITRGRARSSN